MLFDRRYRLLKGEARKLSDPSNLRRIEDELCRETGSKDWAIGLTADQPLITEKAEYWRVYLTAYEDIEEPKNLLEDMLSASAPFPLTD